MKLQPLTDTDKLAIASAVGLILVFAGAYIGEMSVTDGVNWGRLVSTLVLSIGGGLVASSMVGVALLVYRATGARKAKAMLCDLFGVRDLSNDIAIVLPRFPFIPTETTAQPQEGSKGNSSLSIKDGRLTNRYSLAFDDIAAARHISAIFVELGIAPPRIEFDDDAWKSLFLPLDANDKLRNYKAFIAIGLFSNDVTMAIANSTAVEGRRHFKLSDSQEFYRGIRGVSYCPKELSSPEWLAMNSSTWDLKIESEISLPPEHLERLPDFALITSCLAPDGRTCLIVGGGRSRGTRKAASHLRTNWTELYSKVRDHPKTNSRSHLFVGIFDLGGAPGSRLRDRGFRAV